MAAPFNFRSWLDATGFNHTEAAAALGVGPDYVSMLAADPASPRYRPASKTIQRKCRQVAAQRILQYATMIVKLSELISQGENES